MPKLYEITTEYDKLLNAIAEADGEISDHLGASLDEVQGEFDEKIINIAKMIKNLEGEQAAFKAEGQRLQKKATSIGNNTDWLKNYIKEGMRRLKTNEVKGKILTVKIRPSPPKCDVWDIDLVPAEFTDLVPASRKADKEAIVLHYKNLIEQTGITKEEILPGVKISVGTTLTIR